MSFDTNANKRFSATYKISSNSYNEAKDIAFATALEQTVECPYSLIENTRIENTLLGNVESLEKISDNCFLATISYDSSICESECVGLLNTLFGNTSLKSNIRLEDISLTDEMYKIYKGPKFGREGIRKLCNIQNGPIFMSAIKPVGYNVNELQNLVYKLAKGGCTIIKDDHNLINQSYAPFKERIKACVDALQRANSETGLNCIYVSNISADANEFEERAFLSQEMGVDAVMASAGLVGFPAIKKLAFDKKFNKPIFMHPALTGAWTLSDSCGISPYCYYGKLTRIMGADAVIFASYGGRFGFTKETCISIKKGTETEIGNLKKAFPVPSGGMKWQNFNDMVNTYGDDTIFLVGGALLTHGKDLCESTKFYVQKLSEASKNK